MALASVVSTFALIILGGIVRVTGSGLGCGGEWPLCDGSLIPPLTKEDIIEYTHRLVASAIVGPLIIATFLVALFRYRRSRLVLVSSGVSVVLLLAQGGLGGVTVLTELPGHIVAAHLALAQALFGCLILVWVAAYRLPGPGSEEATGKPTVEGRAAGNADGFPRLAVITAIATYALLLSGAYVTATPGALAVCPHWPLCDGSFWPSGSLQMIHMLHRVVAAVIGLLILHTAFKAYRIGARHPASGGMILMVLGGFGAAVFIAQVFIGAAAIWLHFPVTLRAAHIGLATAVWGIMAAVALLSLGQPEDRRAGGRRGTAAPDSQAATAATETT